MSTILDTIIEKKREEVLALKKETIELFPADYIKKHSLIDKIRTTQKMAVIAEFKRASPSKGLINGKVDIRSQIQEYAACGADAISVLTDETFFKGSFNDLSAARKETDLPILCKDFIIDKVQIDKARNAGADLILLIAAVLDDQKLIDLYQYAVNLGLEVLVEVHDEEELERALKTETPLIGINNRDLKTFEVNLETTKELAERIESTEIFIISESGIKEFSDVIKVAEAGARGILVGETMMRSENLEETFKKLKIDIKKELIG